MKRPGRHELMIEQITRALKALGAPSTPDRIRDYLLGNSQPNEKVPTYRQVCATLVQYCTGDSEFSRVGPGTYALRANLPNLSRTAAAIEAYDEHVATWTIEAILRLPNAEASKVNDRQDELAREVGVAFGLDTADRNNPETCAALIRPGPKVPAAGSELSFVRRMVAKWRTQS